VGELTRTAVKTIQIPTLLIYGEHSHFMGSYHFLKKTLPNCTPVLLPGGEHFGPLEQPDLLIRHIVEFVGAPAGSIAESLPPIAGTSEIGASEIPCE
jgi:pimeloyl-ACP methyl ester carboxylesterase